MNNKYNCEYCNYTTDKLFCYKRHIKTKKHILNESMIKVNSHDNRQKSKNDYKKVPFKCDACGHNYTNKSNLSRHKKSCIDAKYKNQIKILKDKLKNQKQIINMHTNMVSILRETNNKAIDTVKETSNKALDTIKESVKKHSKSVYNIVINHIKKPIPLKQINDVKQIHSSYKDDEMEEFVRDLCSMYQGGSLYKFLGNFIIKQYKKEDITKQSMFSTDSSRNNFIYSSLDKNNNAVWKKDPRGLNVGSITLDNILMYIQDIIGEQQLKMVKTMPKLNELEILRLSDIISTCNKIDRLIRHNNELKNKIVAYLSSNFGFDEKELLLGNIY